MNDPRIAIDEDRKWPREVFRPVFQYVREQYPRITPRRAAKITKGILAALAALSFSKSRNRREEMPDVPLESDAADELRQVPYWLF